MTVSRLKLRREFAGCLGHVVWPTAVAERLIHSAIAAILSPPRHAKVRLGIDPRTMWQPHHGPGSALRNGHSLAKQALLKPINKPIPRLPESN
jgi:hypothetical protein